MKWGRSSTRQFATLKAMMRSTLIALAASAALSAAPPSQGVPRVLAVNVDGMISPITVEIVGHALDQAAAGNAAVVLLRLNTPGGLMDSAREINEKIVAARVPVIAYVTPSGGRAASAGFFLLEAADVAVMAPGTNTGASSPVLLTGEMDETMRKKVENDASAWLRSVVAKRGHNADLAEKTIREAKAFTEKESLDDHLIDLIEPDEAQLLAALDGRQITRFDGRHEILHTVGAAIDEYQPSARERIVNAVADPNIGFLLLIIGALGVYVEFTSPGLILPGVAGGILFLLGLSSLAVMPINWIGAALLLLGGVLLILEVKFASHGVLGIGGTVSMVLGALLLVNGPPEVRIHLATALAVVVPFAMISLFLVTLAVRARRNKAVMSDGGLLNQLGQARTALAPAGTVFVHGEYWDAVSSSPVESGAEVRVVAIDGLKLRVEPSSHGSSK
jgi:membrane-bound serine protease (ClpP class)